jgi:hypothetical protein
MSEDTGSFGSPGTVAWFPAVQHVGRPLYLK